jgi:uncharacterized glyoxalase superfamily protein PhnB
MVELPLGKMFWGAYVAVFRDRIGILRIINLKKRDPDD